MRYKVNISIIYNNDDKLLYTEEFNTKGDNKKVLKSNLRRIYEKAYEEHNYDDNPELNNIKITHIYLYGLQRIESIDIKRLFLNEELEKVSKKLGITVNEVNYETNRINKKSARNTSK